MTIGTQCARCKHYWGVGKCEAFTKQIPDEILTGEFDHTKPYEGDGGIRFEAIKQSSKKGNSTDEKDND